MRPTQALLLLFSALTLSLTASAQYSPLRSFIPPGYTIIGQATADIDKDGCADRIIVLRNPYEHMNADTTRPLLLLKGNGKGGYRLLARNDSVVLCYNCGGVHGDPFQRVTASDGRFTVWHFGGSGWRWIRIITFGFDKHTGQFLLTSDCGRSWHADESNGGTPITHRPEDFRRITFTQFSYAR